MTVALVLLSLLGAPLDRGGPAEPVPPARGGHALQETSVQMGERLAAQAGWVGGEWRCLWRLWDRESHWHWWADNLHSDAYGIPQALPGSKMGVGWERDPLVQIRWGLRYIRGRYGTPCAALAHSNTSGYY